MIQSKVRQDVFDRVVIGAGIFGLYSAWRAGQKGERVLVIEKEQSAFTKASYVNQARIHNGYHYPRSLSTALSTISYVNRFIKDFDFAVNRSFEQIYAIATNFSYTNKICYERFCKEAGIRCDEINVRRYFNPEQIQAAYLTDEYSVDAIKLRDFFLHEIAKLSNVKICYSAVVDKVEVGEKKYFLTIKTADGVRQVEVPKVMNFTYASLNEVVSKFGFTPLSLKYEYAEVILCQVSDELKEVGLTVMDGPFFSLMPFGFSGLHSLTAVSYTPHISTHQPINESEVKCQTHFDEMSQLAKKFMRTGFDITYQKSLYATKSTLAKTELDDARPTAIIEHSHAPYFVSVLSGKLNTIFDLDQII